MVKEIRYNVPSYGDVEAFGDEPGLTLHTDGVTVYFDEIRDDRGGFTFLREDTEVAWVGERDAQVSPVIAKQHAKENPNELVRFSD